jgi:biotin carboxylase
MSTRPPAVILLGGLVVAWNQRFLDAARRRDLHVLLLDGPATPLADLRSHGVADVARRAATDLDGVVERCVAWAQEYDVKGVCCLREEYVEATGLVADLLDLPSPGLRAARVCRNKYLQRRYLADWSPVSRLASPETRQTAVEEWEHFPLVVKPVGRLASSGVRLVGSAEALLDCVSEYDADETLLLEERVTGPEFSVESLSRDGELVYAEVTEKRTTEGASPYFVELGHTTPAIGLHPAARGRLLAVHAAVVARLGMRTGMAHGEYRVTPGGRVVLTEVAVRPPGDSIMTLHWLATGAPLEDAVVGLAVGEDVTHPHAARFARQVYLPHEPGVLAGLDVDPGCGVEPAWFDLGDPREQVTQCGSPSDPPALRCVVALKPVGTTLGRLRESADRAAMFVVDAATPPELDQIATNTRSAVTLRVRS